MSSSSRTLADDAPAISYDLAGTLDEPVMETLKRDFQKIGQKLKHVLIPTAKGDDAVRELKNWDLWGPLLLCLSLSIMLSLSAPAGQEMLLFASVFAIFWVGSGVVTLNAQLLGSNISFFQSVCVLGYCVFPLNIGSLLCALWGNWIYRVIVCTVCFIWATRASVVFMRSMVEEKRTLLAVYPVYLFYLVLTWIIIIE
eukprot:g652.t1